jgi:hypothetical protein
MEEPIAIELFPPLKPELGKLKAPLPPAPRVITSVLPAVTVSTLHEYAPTPPSPPFANVLVEPTLPLPPPAPQSWANIFVILAGTTKVFCPAVLNSLIVVGIKLWPPWAFRLDTAPNNKKPIAALINPGRHDAERLRRRPEIISLRVFTVFIGLYI